MHLNAPRLPLSALNASQALFGPNQANPGPRQGPESMAKWGYVGLSDSSAASRWPFPQGPLLEDKPLLRLFLLLTLPFSYPPLSSIPTLFSVNTILLSLKRASSFLFRFLFKKILSTIDLRSAIQIIGLTPIESNNQYLETRE